MLYLAGKKYMPKEKKSGKNIQFIGRNDEVKYIMYWFYAGRPHRL